MPTLDELCKRAWPKGYTDKQKEWLRKVLEPLLTSGNINLL